MKPTRLLRHAWLLTLVVCLALTGLASAWQARRNAGLTAEALNRSAENLGERLRKRIDLYEYGLRSLRGLYIASSKLTLQEFETYCSSRDLANEFPGTRGFGIVMRVKPGEEAAFTAAAIQDGQADFRIRSLGPNEGERLVIKYIEGGAINHQATGLDIASETRRREAAVSAMRSGQKAITAPLTIVQEPSRTGRAFLILLPIYRPGMPLGTDEERDRAAIALTYSPLVIDELLHTVMEEDENLFTLALRDLTAGDPAGFYRSMGHQVSNAGLPMARVQIGIYDRAWEAEVQATPAFMSRLRLTPAWLIFSAGSVLSLLLATLSHALAMARMRALEVRVEQERRARMVESSHDAIIGIDAAGHITDWNPAACQLFGLAAAAVLGKPLKEVLPAPPEEDLDARLNRLTPDDRMASYESTRQNASGETLDVWISLSTIRDQNDGGVSITLRDIGEASRARKALTALNDSLETQVAERTELLDAARRKLQTIMDSVPSIIGYWDSELINRAANQAYQRMLGSDAPAVEGRHMLEVVGPDMFERNRPFVEAALRGETQNFEREIQLPETGEKRYLQLHFLPDVVNGEVRGFHTLGHDVTDLVESRSRLAAALRENKALLQTINDQTIVSVTDAQGLITEANDGFCRISGYGIHELVGHSHAIVNSGVHPPEFWREMWKTVTSGRSWRREVCNRAKDGSLYWVDSIIAPFRGDDGRIERYISIRSDISARKQTESTLARLSSMLSGVLDAASEVSIIASDPQGLITVFNSGAERMLGYRAEDMVGRQTPAILHVDDELQARARELSAETGEAVSGFAVFVRNAELRGSETRDWTYVRKDGTRFPVSLTVTCIRNEALEIQGYLGIAHDISQQQEYARSLRDAILREKKANLAKSQFLANMSHEIRTPMNAVIGLAFLLEQTRLSPEQTELLAKLQVAGKSLLGIINDILDISKIEAGELRIERAPFCFSYALREVVQLFENPAREKRIRLTVSNPVEENLVFEGDLTRLRQILVNLVSNAIKFTETGEVRISVDILERRSDFIGLRFEVRDSGIGIAPEAVPRLFQPFSQEDASTTRRFGGTGLGLSIVRQLVSLMQGKLGVSSVPGQGSCFWFELGFPLGHTPPADTHPPAAPKQADGLAGVRILIVDDSEINRMVARRILELAGAQVETAGNGKESIDRLAAGLEVDLVLMDIHMPVMDGFDATREIRRLPATRALPVIALSAGTMEINKEQALEAGMDDFVGKPFNAEKLVACIRQHLDLKPRMPESPLLPRAVVDAAWPVIEGVDAESSRQRFAGDAALFRRMLDHLFEEFSELTPPADGTPDPHLTSRLHTLKGNAGTLGATRLAAAAGDAEHSARKGEWESLPEQIRVIREMLAALRKALLSAAPPAIASPAASAFPGAADTPERIEALILMLRQADLDALELHAEIGKALEARLGPEAAARLGICMQTLRFDEALQLLDAAGISGSGTRGAPGS